MKAAVIAAVIAAEMPARRAYADRDIMNTAVLRCSRR